MQIIDYLNMLKPNARRGSKPRCHLLTHGDKKSVAARLTEIIHPWGEVNVSDCWMPEGFKDLSEAELDKAVRLLDVKQCNELKSWWLIKASSRSKTPNWDIASTCTIEGRKGMLLIEGKAHFNELRKEESQKRLKTDASPNSKLNHDNIGKCIEDAANSLSKATSLSWHLSHGTHYQIANRFTWAWQLTQMGIPVILVYLGFVNADEMKDISNPYADDFAWKGAVLNHSKTLFPEMVWNKKWLINDQPFIPLIRTCKISINESL